MKVIWTCVIGAAAALAASCVANEQQQAKGAGGQRGSSAGGRAGKPARLAIPPQPKLPPPAPLAAAPEQLPQLVATPPPAGMEQQLRAIEQQLTGAATDKKAPGTAPLRRLNRLLDSVVPRRPRTRRRLRAAVPKAPSARHDPRLLVLARYLSSRQAPELARRGVRLWHYLTAHRQFWPTVVALFGHTDEKVRADALKLAARAGRRRCGGPARPYLQLVLERDKSCIARRRALEALLGVRASKRCAARAKVALRRALGDSCAAVRELAWSNLHRGIFDLQGADAALGKQLLQAASRSPFAIERCAALRALGRLGDKSKRVKQLLAKALTDAVLPTMVVSYGDGTELSLRRGLSVPECSMDALKQLYGDHGGKLKRERRRRFQLRDWWQLLHEAGLIPRPAPEPICLQRTFCGRDHVCLNMRCTALQQAKDAYWDYARRQRCAPPTPTGQRNGVPDAARAAGFGLDPRAPELLADHLRRSDAAGFKRRQARIGKRRCRRTAARR